MTVCQTSSVPCTIYNQHPCTAVPGNTIVSIESNSYQQIRARLQTSCTKLVTKFYNGRTAEGCDYVHRLVNVSSDPLGNLRLCGRLSTEGLDVVFSHFFNLQAAGLLKLNMTSSVTRP